MSFLTLFVATFLSNFTLNPSCWTDTRKAEVGETVYVNVNWRCSIY